MLRVLDLGAHDGFVSAWLSTQLPAGSLHVDGVELHPLGVSTMNRRLAELGIEGTCKQGLAEDAPALFQPGTYDAVVAYEIIEHVPDMGRFLAVCESMLATGGRVYLSTPDGCFGQGFNPHHLRALRSIDLAELVRRRGRILDMEVGGDGIASIAYAPAWGRRERECAIYTGPAWDPWAPQDIQTRGLGGSETAAVKLAEALAATGWTVTVYGDVEQGIVGQVVYRHHEVFDPLAPVDLLIASRLPEVFDRPHNAKRAMLWLHDVDCGDRLTPARAERVDDVLVLSEWQQGHVRGRYPFAADKVRRIRNGIDLARFAGAPVERAKRVLYTSSPDRGLDVLLELWPQVLARVPDAQLNYCYSPVYWRVAELDPVVGRHAARIRELSDQPGVENLGHLPQPALAMLMRESLVWTLPSWASIPGQPWHETSCIGAMEAQAAGCHVVASNWGALSETVKVGARVDGPPLSEAWCKRFVDEMVAGLTNPAVQGHAQIAAPAAAAQLGWDGVAELVEALVGTPGAQLAA